MRERRTRLATARVPNRSSHIVRLLRMSHRTVHMIRYCACPHVSCSSSCLLFFHLCIHSSELTHVDCIAAWRCYCDIRGVKDMSKVNPTVARIPPKWYLDVFLPDGQSPLRMEVTAKTAIGTHRIVESCSNPHSPFWLQLATVWVWVTA